MPTQKRVENEIKIIEKDLENIDPTENPERYKELQKSIDEIEKDYAKEESEYWEKRFREDYG